MSFNYFGKEWSAGPGVRSGCRAAFPLVLLLLLFGGGHAASGQVVQSAVAGGISLSAGGTFSGYSAQYGERKLLGVTGFADLDSKSQLGVEAEARWLVLHQTANVHISTYTAGLRYHFNVGNYQPYVKALGGYGKFNFPYNYAKGTYPIIAPGGGVDYRISKRVKLRLVDCEYQYWPGFTYGGMTSVGLSSGIRFKIF
jgi:hypothetical protein